VSTDTVRRADGEPPGERDPGEFGPGYSPLYVVALGHDRASSGPDTAAEGARSRPDGAGRDALIDELAELRGRGARLLIAVRAEGAGELAARLTRRGLAALVIPAPAPADEAAGDVAAAARLTAVLRAYDAVCLAAGSAGPAGSAAAAATAGNAGTAGSPPGSPAGDPDGLDADIGARFRAAMSAFCPAVRAAALAAARVSGADHVRLVAPTAAGTASIASLTAITSFTATASLGTGVLAEAAAGAADVALTGPGTLSAVGGTRLWRAAPPSPRLELLSRMVEISSVSGDERELAAYLADWSADHGLRAEIDPAGNLVACRGSGPRRLLMLGHLDTVPYRWPVCWDGDVLTGRGCVDAKAGLAAYLETLAGLEVPPGAQVRVVGAVNEERTSAGAFAVRDSYPADAVIIGEPSGSGALTIGYFGLCKILLAVSEATAHTAGRGIRTAADRMVDLIAAVRAEVGRISPEALLAVLDLSARDEGDVQAGQAVADIRLPPGADRAQLLAAVRQAAADAGARVAMQRCTPGVTTARSSPLVRAFSRAFRAAQVTPRFLVKKGSSDMNTLATSWHAVPMVAYAPGDSALDHTPHERIDAAEYLRAARVLRAAVRNWLDSAPTTGSQT
jgi:N-acetyl-ornithine/N-acetyl-lysine deacetylase